LAITAQVAAAHADKLSTTYIASASVDLKADTVTMPLYEGSLKNGQKVWYILTDASDQVTAKNLGLAYAPSLTLAANAHSTRSAVRNADGAFTFEAGSVDFSPQFNIVPGAAPL
jgi:hypothetical protein